jgi:Flp pilus assembly protein TadG
MRALADLIRRLRRGTRGSIAVELAFAVPVLTGLLMSGVEVTRYVLINQKLERTAATMGDLITRMPELTEGDITSFFAASDLVMTPYDVRTDGRVIISSIARDGGGPEIIWQRTYGLISAASRFGDTGDAAVLPAGFEVRDGENVVTAEIFFDFEPIMMTGVLEPTQLYSRAVFRPRFGTLTTVLP